MTLVASNAGNTDSITKTAYIFVNPNGLMENGISRINIYPNPSLGIFNIELTNKDNSEVQLEVFNALNQRVIRTTMKDTYALDLSTEPVGIYIVHLVSESGSYNLRVVKQ